MNKKFLKFIYLSLFLAIISANLLVFIEPGQAVSTQQDLQDQLKTSGVKGWGNQVTNPNSMTKIVEIVIRAFLGLLGIIFLVLIIYAGYSWMTAQGDEEKVTAAKDTLTRAIIGLVIIVAAYSITYFVFTNLVTGENGSI